MDNNFENYHHHHQWRPGPTQPNICPICTAPHFPFCSPYPPPSFSHNPNFPPPPPHINSARPGLDSFTGPPIRPHNHYPIGDPRPWQAHHGNQWRPVSDYRSGVDCDREVDRSYKRARIDGDSPGYGVSGSDGYHSPRISWENEQRSKMVWDHGYGINAPPPGNLEMNHQYGRSEFRNGGQFNGVAPPPPPSHHPPLPATAYGGYYGGPNGQPPLPVSPPPPLPPSHPSSLFPVTANSSATVPPSSSYPQMPNASVMLLS